MFYLSDMQSIMPLMMLLQGGGMNPGDQNAMTSMLPMMLMMMDDTEVDDDGEVVSVHVSLIMFSLIPTTV